MKDTRYVSCNQCGWVHFAVSPEYIKQWEAEWKVLFETKPKEWLELYGITDKPPSAEESYHKCFRCRNNYKDFHDTVEEEVPQGSTIQPIRDPLT